MCRYVRINLNCVRWFTEAHSANTNTMSPYCIYRLFLIIKRKHLHILDHPTSLSRTNCVGRPLSFLFCGNPLFYLTVRLLRKHELYQIGQRKECRECRSERLNVCFTQADKENAQLAKLSCSRQPVPCSGYVSQLKTMRFNLLICTYSITHQQRSVSCSQQCVWASRWWRGVINICPCSVQHLL